jgi:integrase
LRRGFYALREDDMIPAVPKVKLYAEKNARQRYLTKDEYNRFLTSLEDLGFSYLVPVVELAVKTGWRKETILNIQWQHIDREDKTIVLPYLLTKNDEQVTYPYDEDTVVKSRIEQLWKKRNNPVPYVFLNKDGTDRIRDFRFAWNKAVAEAKIGDGDGYGAGFQAGFKFHDLKRTNIVWNEEAGVSRSVTKEISGTKTDIIFDRYNIVDKKRMRKAIKKRQDSITEDTSKKGPSMVEFSKESAVDQARETE